MTPEQLLVNQTRMRDGTKEKVLQQVLARWDALGSWNKADVDRLLRAVIPLVQAGQLTTASVTDTYLSTLIAQLRGTVPTATGLARADVTDLRPVPPDEVYRRPFVQTWTALANGTEFTAAVALGRDRLERLVWDDLDLAHRKASLMVIDSSDSVLGYRRVIRPELAKTGTCDLCISASDRKYGREDLMPIHTRCGCDVMPIVSMYGGRLKDPAKAMNDEDLAGSAVDRKAATVHQHGELGPVLRRSGDSFATLEDIAA